MQKKGANISLKGYDDIFSTDQSRAEAQQERVQEIPLSELHPFEGHPFRVVDDEEMMKTVESVRDFGVLTPAIVRPDPYGGYEIISGHRRHRASELAGKETMPAIVRDMDDDAAIILMVDSNLQRETLLPSERAFAYHCAALYVVAHKLLNLFYGAVVLARLFPYGEKLSWRTRRLARYRRNVPVCLLCCAPKAAFFVKEQ